MAADRPFYDALETRDPEAREAALMAALPGQVALAKCRTGHWGRLLARIEPEAVASRAALAALPVTRKAELPERQRQAPPFGGLAAAPPGRLHRLYASPGPIYEAEGAGPDYWRTARALWANGFRPGDIVQNCFAYHFTPAGAMFETGAHAIGCAVIPAGTGATEQQARAVHDLRPTGYVGTPDFLKLILEKVEAQGLDAASLRLAHVSGGPFLPALKSFYADRGIQALESYGTAELGLIAYQSPAREGLIAEEHAIVEIVRLGSGEPVPAGEVGEVVVTTFSRDFPLLRFATGDLSAVLPGPSPCGRTNLRLRGWLGRADQATKVRGLFVHPAQLAELQRRHPEIARVRLVVEQSGGLDHMTLKVETAATGDALTEAIAASLQSLTKLRGAVQLVPPGALPTDGKTIEDARRYDV